MTAFIPTPKRLNDGDVLSRFTVKAAEILDSADLIERLITEIPEGPVCSDDPVADGYALSAGGIRPGAEPLLGLDPERPDRTVQGQDSLVLQLAGNRTCGSGQHRAGLPGHQQEPEPVVCGDGPVRWIRMVNALSCFFKKKVTRRPAPSR